jgi:hypothetical protein
MLVEVPDVPLVEGKVDRLLAAKLVLDVVGGYHDGIDEVLHIERGSQV